MPLPPLYMPFTAPSPTPRDQQLPLNRLLPERPTNCPPLHEPPSDLDPASGSSTDLSRGEQPATSPQDHGTPETPQASIKRHKRSKRAGKTNTLSHHQHKDKKNRERGKR